MTFMRTIPALALFSAFLYAPAARAADTCSLPKILNTIQMRPALNGSDLIPVGINGVEKLFLFDTGGGITQIARNTALDLSLPLRQGNIRMYDLAGNVSRDQANVGAFTFGRMSNRNMVLPVSPPMPFEGIFAPDRLLDYDVDVDFGADTLNLFSPDHCPGGAPAWQAMAMAPITLEGTHIVVPVTLDGQTMNAILDTGAGRTTLQVEYAQRLFMFPLGDAQTPENGVLNGVSSLKTYGHIFQNLAFGTITIHNPRVTLIPDAMGRGGDPSRTQSELTIAAPKMIIGMDVLRQLHVYIAFKERKMYVSQASHSPVASPAPATGQ